MKRAAPYGAARSPLRFITAVRGHETKILILRRVARRRLPLKHWDRVLILVRDAVLNIGCDLESRGQIGAQVDQKL